ncbi:MAG: diguanylate cyclase with sensor [Firmicutes bacterium]|nr:diguanylate cyclase with sensor [Bacillota bacterium]
MEEIHKLLKKQLQKKLRLDPVPVYLENFIQAVNSTYYEFENDIGLMERSIDISSREYNEVTDKLRKAYDSLTTIHEELRYLSMHDTLTGLYNRAYLELEMQQLQDNNVFPVGIIVCDTDGLKLVNDSFGHAVGDQFLVASAEIIRRSIRTEDIPFRIGGDEFLIILPQATEAAVQSVLKKMESEITAYNQQNVVAPVSISIGYCVKNDAATSLEDVVKEADNQMYKEKLLHSQSAHSAIVQTMMKLLQERDFMTEEHSERLQDLVLKFAIKLGVPSNSMASLQLFAKFHDIGKAGIADNILKKPGPLNEAERQEMQRHCEIGFRIAQASMTLLPIAPWILMHQEWWNGKGYPLGIGGEEIPLECRILAIADAYDAMISDRPYRKALTKKVAVAELERCAGTQFDPKLVKVFVQVVS